MKELRFWEVKYLAQSHIREIVVKFADSGRTIFSDFLWGAPSPVLNNKGGAVGTSIWYSDNKV